MKTPAIENWDDMYKDMVMREADKAYTRYREQVFASKPHLSPQQAGKQIRKASFLAGYYAAMELEVKVS